jgi:hypothetical protein
VAGGLQSAGCRDFDRPLDPREANRYNNPEVRNVPLFERASVASPSPPFLGRRGSVLFVSLVCCLGSVMRLDQRQDSRLDMLWQLRPRLHNLAQIGVFSGNLRQVGFGVLLNHFGSNRFSGFGLLTLNQRVAGSIPASPSRKCGLAPQVSHVSPCFRELPRFSPGGHGTQAEQYEAPRRRLPRRGQAA